MAKTHGTNIVKRLEDHEKQFLFAGVLLVESMYSRIVDSVNPENFPESDDLYRFWVQELGEYVDAYGKWPTVELFHSKVQESVKDDINFEEFREAIDSMFRIATRLRNNIDDYVGTLNEKLSLFVGEVISAEYADILSKPVKAASTVSIVDEMRDKLLIATATDDDMFADPIDLLMSRPAGGRAISTGITFVDAFTGGRPAVRECVLHGAVSGGGKSTLINQVAANIAIDEQRTARETGRSPQWVYIVNYERVEDPIQHMISNIGNISRDSISQFITTQKLDHFSQGGDIDSYKPYEQKKFRELIKRAQQDRGKWPLGELGRFNRTRQLMSRNIKIVDFSHSTQSLVKYATNLVDGIQDYVEAHQKKIGNPGVAFIGLDYAGTCANTHIGATAKSDSQLRRVLIQIPLDCKHKLANGFNSIVWISHQLAAAEAKRKPGTAPDKTAFREANGITENVDFAFVSGVPTPNEGLAVFLQSKGRRGVPVGYGIPGRMDNTFCRWESAEADYEVMNNEIMTKADARSLSGRSDRDIRENFD